jgi:mannose/cellobiose epimerase-like protein (N-acyl-D-glucosamine 2-epimerase family)
MARFDIDEPELVRRKDAKPRWRMGPQSKRQKMYSASPDRMNSPDRKNARASACASACSFRDWLVTKALPLWSTAGFDAGQGVFQERLEWRGRPQAEAPRRAMVQARQIYVFAHAAQLGWFPEGGRLAEIAMASLVDKFCDGAGPKRGFAFSISADNRLVAAHRDAYTHAFVLFAIAWLYRLNGDRCLIGLADQTIGFIDAALQDPAHGGLYDRTPVDDRNKRQNPHMHLLEAYLALEAAIPGCGYAERAEKLVEIFKSRLFMSEPGVLLEYFAEDWGAHSDPQRRWVFEPGHNFEWAWLLHEYEKLTGEDLTAWILALDRNARSNGLAENGLIFEEVKCGMSVVKSSHRLWPHAEGAKAAVARFSMGDAIAPEFASAMVNALGATFLDKPFAGGWIDRISANGSPLVDFIPASSLYHLFSAAAEMSRAFRLPTDASALDCK